MSQITRDLYKNDKGTLSVVDGFYTNNNNNNNKNNNSRGNREETLYPVSEILTTEFKGIQVLYYIEEKWNLYQALKSLMLKGI